MHNPTVYYLGGSSYPAMQHMELALQQRLNHVLPNWVGQADVLKLSGEPVVDLNVQRRLAALRTVLPTDAVTSSAILIGFSSGARVASMFSMRYGVRAVVCLGYPFRVVRRLIDPDRWSHFSTVTVPTLILQGVDDPFGGLAITEDYVFSDAVSLRFLATDHNFDLTPPQWDRLSETIRSFLEHVQRGLPFAALPFDEDFYLSLYPDVAVAVRTGVFVSGEAHYRQYGRAERRRFRFLPGV